MVNIIIIMTMYNPHALFKILKYNQEKNPISNNVKPTTNIHEIAEQIYVFEQKIRSFKSRCYII